MEAGLLVTILFLSFASLIHGIAGVGFGMVAMSLFSITLGDFGESVAVVGLLALVVYFLLFLATTRRAKIDWSMVLIITTGGVAGVIAGYGFLLVIQDQSLFKMIVGTVIAGLSILSIFQHKLSLSAGGKWWVAAAVGVIGGFVFSVFIAGGVFIGLYLYSRTNEPADAKPTLQMIFIILSSIRIFVFGVGEFGFSSAILEAALISLLPVVGALFAGHYISTKIRQSVFRLTLFTFLAVTGVAVAVLGGFGRI